MGRPSIKQPDNFDNIVDRIERGELTQKAAAEKLGVSKSTFSRWLKKADKVGKPGPRRMTPPESYDSLAGRIECGDISLQAASKELGVSQRTVRRWMKEDDRCAKTGRPPIKQPDDFDSIADRIERGELTQKAVADELGISRLTVYRWMKEAGRDLEAGPHRKMPPDNFGNMADKIERGEINRKDAAEKLGVSQSTFSRWMKEADRGAKPSPRRMTPPDNFGSLADKIECGDISLQAASRELDVSQRTVRRWMKEEGRCVKRGRPSMKRPEDFDSIADRIERGELSKTKAAETLKVSCPTLNRWMKQRGTRS